MNAGRHHVDVFLMPGQLGVYTRPANVKTVLGSCVAVCLWDRRLRTGGINHYLLPSPTADTPGDLRYGSIATPALIRRMCVAGSQVRDLRAAVVGGGSPLSGGPPQSIGELNARLALAILRDCEIPVWRQETGGPCGRKLLFNTHYGRLMVRTLAHPVLLEAGGRRR